jgi:hypothetical protein
MQDGFGTKPTKPNTHRPSLSLSLSAFLMASPFLERIPLPFPCSSTASLLELVWLCKEWRLFSYGESYGTIRRGPNHGPRAAGYAQRVRSGIMATHIRRGYLRPKSPALTVRLPAILLLLLLFHLRLPRLRRQRLCPPRPHRSSQLSELAYVPYKQCRPVRKKGRLIAVMHSILHEPRQRGRAVVLHGHHNIGSVIGRS